MSDLDPYTAKRKVSESMTQQQAKPYFFPSNIRWLIKSMVSPRAMNASDITPQEQQILKQAFTNSLNRVRGMPQQRKHEIQSAITSLEQLPKDMETVGLDGVSAPAHEHVALLKGLLSRSLQYPDYPQMRVEADGIDKTPILENLTDPSYSMATTIGRGSYVTDQLGNTHIKDTYNFPGKDDKTSLLSKIANAMIDRRFSMGVPEAFAAHYSRNMPVDVQITHGASGGW